MSGISRCLWAILMIGLLGASGAFAQSAAELLERAQRLLAEGKNRETVAACDLALAADPGLAEAHRRRGWALWKLGEYEPALLAFDRAIELDPENPLHPNGRANVLYSLERFDEALADADRAVALKSDYGNALVSRGLIHSALGDEEAARRDHLRATQVEPSNTLAYNNLGVVLKRLGDLRGALAAGDRALEVDPGYETVRRNRSSWRLEAGDPDGAAADAVWLIEHHPDRAFGYDLLGRARLRQDRYTDAMAAFERVVELEPENVAGHHMLGFARFNAGDFRGSERALSRALELDADHVGALMDRGRTRRRLGDLDGALADYDRRLALLPDDALTHNNRGTIWMDRGEPALAKRDFETALRLDPETPDAADNLRTATRRIAAVAGAGTAVGATLPALPVRSHAGPWEPGPETTVLFNGVLGEHWVPHSAAGGSFESHARVVGGELRVDVPAGAAWGKVGLLSPRPLVWLDRFGDGAEAEYKTHPVFAKLQKLKDMCLPVPGGDAFAPWSESFTRSSITGRHHEVLDELEALIDSAANPCEAAYSGKLFVDGQAGLYTEEVLAKLAWEFLGPDEWWLGEKVGQGADWAAATPGNVAGKVGWLSIASDVMSGLSLLDEQWHIGRQNQQLLEAKTLFEDSRSWTPAQVEASVSSLSTDLVAARQKVDEHRQFLSDLRIELFGKYDLARLGPCSELNPIPACQEFAREFQQRGAETSYLMRTEAFKAYGLELKRNLQRDVRRKLQRMSCEHFIQERMASCRH